MIEVNLKPGGGKRSPRRGLGFSVSLPKIGGLSQDRWVLGSGAVVGLIVLVSGYLFWSLTSQYGDVDSAVQEAVQDSARYADLIGQAEELRARRDSIAQRVEIIQEIDQGRYIWPHVLDEVARALPDFTWLTSLVQTSVGAQLQLRITGMAGNNFALTTFMESLEASPFIRGVTLINTQLTLQGSGGVSRSVNDFTLEATYEQPSLGSLQTVPLLESGGAISGTSGTEGAVAPIPSGPEGTDGSAGPPPTSVR